MSSKKFHPVVAKYITQFLFLLLFFLLLFPIDFDGQVAFFGIFFAILLLYWGEKADEFHDFSVVAVLVSSGNDNSCLTTGYLFLTFHSTGRFYVVLQIIVVCPLLIAAVSCGNQSS